MFMSGSFWDGGEQLYPILGIIVTEKGSIDPHVSLT